MEKKKEVSAAKRKANDKWDKENMATVTCKLRKEDADAFREFAKQNDKTVNTLLRDFVFGCIGKSNSKNAPEPEQAE